MHLGTAMDVTDQEGLTQELRRREACLVEAQRLSHTGSFGWSILSGEHTWSEETFKIFEYDRALKPSLELVLQRTHPDDRALVQQTLDRASNDGTNFDVEHRLLMPDGRVKHLHVVADAQRDSSGGVEFIGAVMDITAAKQAEEKIRQNQKDLRTIVETIPAFVWTALPDGSVDFVSQSWLDYTGLSSEEWLGWGWITAIHPEDLESAVEKWKVALAVGEPIKHEQRIRQADGTYRWFLGRNVPLRDEEGNVVKWYGTLVDIEDRKRAEQALQRNEAYLAAAQGLTHTGSFAYGPGSRKTLYWSEELFRIFGLDPQRGIPDSKETLQLLHPDDRERVAESCLQGFREKAQFSQDYRLLLHDGTVKHLHVIWHPVLDKDGELVEYVGTAADVTERKQAEERPRLVLDTTPALIHTARPDGYLDFFNRTWLRYVGLPLEDLEGWKWTAAIHPEDVEGIVNKWRASIASGEPFLHEARVRRADGEYRWMLHHKIAERDEHGKTVKWYGSSVDIDDRKQAEEKLRQDEMELHQIVDVVPQHIFVLEPDGQSLYANRRDLDYTGMNLKDVLGADYLARVIHPDDLERLRYEREHAIGRGIPWESEARLRRKDGQYRWFLIHLNPFRDEQGHILRWYGTRTDIEDRKQAETNLQTALDEIKKLKDQLYKENIALREEIDKASMFEEIVGASPALQSVLSRVAKVAPMDSTVLVTGETGTGKELIARAIHKRSQRASRAFVAANCAAIPRDLIASELFGHEKGAFTGATQRHIGRFELAEGGTIFLDEVGDLPAETQIALLRVLQEHEFERVGGTRSIQTNVRVIAATNRDLQAAIAAGTFRSDLFYRLNVFPIEIPPLRKRKEDIPLLVEYFIDRYARQAGRRILGVNKKTLDLFQSYGWPGNIRELQNVIERSVIVCETESFSVDESWLTAPPPATTFRNSVDLTERLAAQEKEMIEGALRECGGRVFGPSGAAARLGMPRSTLESKIRSLKIDKNRYKSGASSKAS